MALVKVQKTIFEDSAGTSPAEGAVCSVFFADSGMLASLYTTRSGVTSQPNPVTTGADGLLSFYVEGGRYDIDVVHASGSQSYDDYIAVSETVIKGPAPTAEFETVENMVLGITTSGTTIDYSKYEKLGMKTACNNLTSKAGAGDYIKKTVAQAEADGNVIDGTGAPNYLGRNHALTGGTHVAVLSTRTTIAEQIGFIAGIDNSAAMAHWSPQSYDLIFDGIIINTSGTFEILNGKDIIVKNGAYINHTSGVMTCSCVIRSETPAFSSNVLLGKILISSPTVDTIQRDIDNLPNLMWQRFEVTIQDGIYNEDVFVNSKSCAASVNTGGERGGLYIVGKVANKAAVSVKSFLFVNSGGGSFTPAVSHLTVTGYNGRTNEKTAIEFYGCYGAAAHNILFRDTVGDAARCVMAYGSNVSCEANDFGTSLYDFAYAAKHGGTLYDNSNNRLTGLPSSFGVMKKKIGESIGGQIMFSDTSGITYPELQPFDIYGAGNGVSYDRATGSIFGVNVMPDIVSTYQNFFTDSGSYSLNASGSGGSVINVSTGLNILTNGTTSSSVTAYLRRLSTTCLHQINSPLELRAAIVPSVTGGGVVELGVGSYNPSIGGSGEPCVFVRFDQTNINLVYRTAAGVETTSLITTSAGVVGVAIIVQISIKPNNATNVSAANAFCRAKIIDRAFNSYSCSDIAINETTNANFQWSAEVTNPTGTASLSLSDLRLFRAPLVTDS